MATPRLGDLCLVLIIILFKDVGAATHWVVTEDGKIQTMLNSLFQLRKPYDLVALMKQEDRLQKVESVKNDLVIQKYTIEQNEDKETNLEQKLYSSDEDCLTAGKPLSSFDLYTSTVVQMDSRGISINDHINLSYPNIPINHRQPYCHKVIDLDFSMHTFEHLESMQARRNLSIEPETGLLGILQYLNNTKEFGWRLSEVLYRNKTSWLLYNLAAYYWRLKGDAYNAIECARRALHFSPWTSKDIALINLSNILHRARHSEEAAVVAFAAISAAPSGPVGHYTLGAIYATVGDYNLSAMCFSNARRLEINIPQTETLLHAVRCAGKLERALEEQHASLQRTLAELKDYQRRHEILQKYQEKLLTEHASQEERMASQMFYEELKVGRTRRGDECVSRVKGECKVHKLLHQADPQHICYASIPSPRDGLLGP